MGRGTGYPLVVSRLGKRHLEEERKVGLRRIEKDWLAEHNPPPKHVEGSTVEGPGGQVPPGLGCVDRRQRSHLLVTLPRSRGRCRPSLAQTRDALLLLRSPQLMGNVLLLGGRAARP